MKRLNWFKGVSILFISLNVAASDGSKDLVVLKEVDPHFKTNTYLVYDQESKEAAFIDAGSKTDSLLEVINKKKLRLKYILITHCHPDHICGIPKLKKLFPMAEVCFSKAEYNAMLNIYSNWKDIYPELTLKILRSSPERYQIASMNYHEVGKPDHWVSEGSSFVLGKAKFNALEIPGHAPGSICYYTDGIAFSGDELYYQGVGETSKYPNSSFEKQVESIRKLYRILENNTIVYPGHGQHTYIGKEKASNPVISLSRVEK